MSNEDKWIEEAVKAKPDSATQRMIDEVIKAKPDNATQWLIKQAQEAHQAKSAVQHLIKAKEEEYWKINKYAADWIKDSVSFGAAKAIGEIIKNHKNGITSFAIPTVSIDFAKAVHASAMIPEIHSQAAKALIDSANSVDYIGISKAVQDIAEQAKNIRFDLLGGFAGSAALAAYKLFQPQIPGILDAINGTFAGTVADALRQALEVRDEESFARFEKIIDDKLEELPNSKITSEGMWFFILQILIPLLALAMTGYQIYDSKQDSKTQAAQFGQIMTVLQHIAENTERKVPEEDDSTYYVVERQATIYIKPNTKSAAIAVIFPNQKVRLVKRNHKWIYIEYFDYLDGVPKYGWGYKKYFKMIKD